MLQNEQDKAIFEQVIQAFHNDDADAVARLLQTHAWLASQIDTPCFAFDSPAIVVAAGRGNRRMVDVLLEHGANINAKSAWWAGGFGVLHHDHHELSRYLIGRGAQVDAHAAAALGMLDSLREMVADNPSVVNQPGPDGQVPLHFAESREVIDFLLSHGAEIDKRDIDHGSTPAQWAADNAEKCGYLVERGAAADIFMACILGDVDLARRLIETDPGCLHAQVGQRPFTSGDSDGGHIYEYKIGTAVRPLFLAARLPYREITELLLMSSPIEHRFGLACLQADVAGMQAILSGQPSLVQTLQPEDQSWIADAARDNRTDSVRAMLEAGFPVDARRNFRSSTALHHAARRGNREMVQLLLARGASVHATNEYGGSPLGSCIWGSLHLQEPLGDYSAVAESLIAAGAALPDRASGSAVVQDVLVRYGVPK